MAEEITKLQGCCKKAEDLRAAGNENRPGLEALDYRIGTHGSFLADMLARLSEYSLPMENEADPKQNPLAALTCREGDDFSIALLDGWAIVADVLCFYQERIANEGYLRTATERRSILELAKLIGYAPKPGVSASVDLAFSLEKGCNAEIPAGTRVQSLPNPGETPQTFESSEKVAGRAEWNLIKPRMKRPQRITWDLVCDNQEFFIYFQGLATNLKPNQPLLFVFDQGMNQQVMRRIKSVEPQPKEQRTRVTIQKTAFKKGEGKGIPVQPANRSWNTAEIIKDLLKNTIINIINFSDGKNETQSVSDIGDLICRIDSNIGQGNTVGLSTKPKDSSAFSIYAMRVTASLFGHNAPKFKLEPNGSNLGFSPQSVNETETMIYLDNTYEKIVPESWVAIEKGSSVFIAKAKEVKSSISRSDYGITGKTTCIKFDRILHWLPDSKDFDVLREIIVNAQSDDITSKLAEEPIETDVNGNILELDGFYEGLDAGRRLVVSGEDRIDIGTMMPEAEKVVIAKVLHSFLTTDHGLSSPQVELEGANFDYTLSVKRWDAYSKDLFEPALEFAPCETGFQPIRTCVSIKTFDGKSATTIIDVSSLELSEGLDKFRFSLGNRSPKNVFLEIRDRSRNLIFKSNIVSPEIPKSTPCVTPPFIVTTDRRVEKTKILQGRKPKKLYVEKWKILYVLAVTNWFDFEANGYDIGFHYVGTHLHNEIKPKKVLSNTDLMNISFEAILDKSEPEPEYYYIDLKSSSNDVCYSNLASTEPISFLPGDSLHTILVLSQDLKNIYKRDTVSIYANLARATHGETRNEVLGSGDSAQALQQFKLRHYPLTYLPAPTPTGAVSTLQLRVNDVLWHESDSLLGLDPKSRSYIIRTDAEIKSGVTFGNGQKGARLPTGVENVKAKYRSGIGKPGNVRAGQIRLLATKPLGLKGVINPLPASGGADPESNDQARRNAPLTVMALDRLVSVQDYEDLARCFAGIGKASAALLTDGKREVVHVSIAGVDDIPIDEDSDLFQNLLLALRRAGDPHQPLVLDLCERLILLIRAKVRLLPDYEWQSVEPKIRAALLQAFGFANRDPGQEVFRSEIVSVIQAVPGVAYVDLDLVDDISEREALDLVKTTQKIRSLMDELSRPGSSEEAADGKPVTQDRIDVEKARVVKAHIVEDGETLASIAELYDGTTDADLLYLNSGLLAENPGLLVSTPLEKSKPIQIWPQLLPAQIAYLSADIPEAVVLKELI